MGRGRRPFAKWMGDHFVPYERYPQVLSFRFRPAGVVGAADTFEALLNIGVSAAIFGVVKVRTERDELDEICTCVTTFCICIFG